MNTETYKLSEETQNKLGLGDYDGSVLHKRFAYNIISTASKENNIVILPDVNPLGNIFISVGNMDVGIDNMIDLEDVIAGDTIASDKAVNIIWEIPGLDAYGAVCFQRLFNTLIAGIIDTYISSTYSTYMDGDDILLRSEEDGLSVPKRKASVSITHVKDGAALGHTGLNISAGSKAPDFAFSITDLEDPNVRAEFISYIEDTFFDLIYDIFKATTKIIS